MRAKSRDQADGEVEDTSDVDNEVDGVSQVSAGCKGLPSKHANTNSAED